MNQTITAERRTIWVDVEDFFKYFEANPRPSGIQRLVFETLKVLPAQAAAHPGSPRIAFVRHSADDALLREVTFDNLAALFDVHSRAASVAVKARARTKPLRTRRPPMKAGLRHLAIRTIERLPPEVADVLLQAGVLQIAALRQFKRLLRRHPVQTAESPAPPEPVEVKGGKVVEAVVEAPALAATSADLPVRPGEPLLIMGAPWANENYGNRLARFRAKYRLEPALLLYDLIPVRRPEWCDARLVQDFTDWLESTLPQCKQLMAISRATAADVEAYARECSLKLSGPVVPVPIGTDFGVPTPTADAGPGPGLPAPGSYILFVSTMEARKNHAVLFRVWRRLLSEMPPDRVPTLVFAGRVGWLISDLLQQLENTDWLGGKVRMIRDPTDTELNALYDGCQFTIFPSLFEGWGLPVSESLGRGRPCLASNRTSLPESGGTLARYFDPENLDDAVRAVRDIIEDPAGLAAWQAQVAREYRHVPWGRTAEALIAACLPDAETALAQAAQ
ncbi:MAG TPA: glycosyltransferase family 1 protein [Alphaproteobacteria bacterium]|nr:glycosyltransferase family 1 protein [Alphaproteobacteria bacterium]